MSILRLRHKPQPVDLPLVLCTGGNQVAARGFDATVAQQIGQLSKISADLVENRSKQVAQVVREYLSRIYTCILAQSLHLSPDPSATEFFSAFCAKNRTGVSFLFFRVLEQLAAEFFWKQDGADLTFEHNFRFAALCYFHSNIRHFTDPNAGGANGFHQKSQPFPSQFVGCVQKASVAVLRQLAVGISK